jgi:nucleotide-binding universal stress UspA family protein
MPEHRRTEPLGVVVGYDGSWRSEIAVARAADEAVRRHTSLGVVTVVPEVPVTGRSLIGVTQEQALADEQADRQLRDVVQRVRRHHTGLAVTAHRVPEDPANGLRDLSERAVLLVVGARGRGGQVGFGMGTVSRAMLRMAACPVLVVPQTAGPADGARPRRPLVVAGVDADGLAPAVLRAAVEEAGRGGGRVRLLHAYAERPAGTGLQRARAFCRDLVRDVVPGGAGVTSVVTPEPPSVALVRHAAGADVVVVGTRGPGALAGLAVESVSRAVLEAMPCAVLVVTPRAVTRLLPPQRSQPGIPRLPSARTHPQLAARARARQAAPRPMTGT